MLTKMCKVLRVSLVIVDSRELRNLIMSNEIICLQSQIMQAQRVEHFLTNGLCVLVMASN